VEEWKQNWDEVFINEVRRERKREEREKKGGRERERKEREKKGKCYEMFGDRKE
jgi:hypothetical protein